MINMLESYNVHSTKEIKPTAMGIMARRGMITQKITNALVLNAYKSVESQLKLLYPDGKFPSETLLDQQWQLLYYEYTQIY